MVRMLLSCFKYDPEGEKKESPFELSSMYLLAVEDGVGDLDELHSGVLEKTEADEAEDRSHDELCGGGGGVHFGSFVQREWMSL